VDIDVTPDIAADRAAQVLGRALQRPVAAKSTGGPDKLIPVSVEIGNRSYRLQTIWVGRGWPADLDVLGGISNPWPRDLIVTARELSPGALERLAALDANYADESGRVRIEGPDGLLIHLEPRSPPRRKGKDRFRWSRSSEQIAEYLLASRPDILKADELAEKTGWSHAQTSSVLQRFDHQGWTQKTGATRGRYAVRRLADSAALLDVWAAHLASTERTQILAHRALREPMTFLRNELGPALAQAMPWAASGWAGLEAAAPFVTAVPVLQVYVPGAAIADGRLRDVMKKIGLREVDEGARVEFWEASDLALKLAEERRSLPVVSSPRLYADLRSLGGRGEEAAAHVREELLGF
jgi:hypothetical protein